MTTKDARADCYATRKPRRPRPEPSETAVAGYMDPETNEFILSSNHSPHAEIRATTTIDLEACR